jgi:hypothetical protein
VSDWAKRFIHTNLKKMNFIQTQPIKTKKNQKNKKDQQGHHSKNK